MSVMPVPQSTRETGITMARRTTATAAACTLAAAALVLTACGGSGDKKIAATTSGTPAAAPSAGATTTPPPTSAPAAPTFDFPPDVKVVVDPDTTGDATKDAVLRDQGYGLQAIYVALTKGDPELPLLHKYVIEDALATWSGSIKGGKEQHLTVTGDLRFYNRKVTSSSATTAGVTFCEDQRYSYDKHTDTGKIDKTKPSANSFVFHTALMRKSADGTWQMANYKSQRGAAQCQL
jgi:hypothetical protein